MSVAAVHSLILLEKTMWATTENLIKHWELCPGILKIENDEYDTTSEVKQSP